MKKHLIYLIPLIVCIGCKDSKWETIKGSGINDEPKTIDKAIYIENLNNAVIGGYTIVFDKSSKNPDHTVLIPTLYLTNDGGKNWKAIHFDKNIKTSIDKVYLNLDTLICQTDSAILFSINKGLSFKQIKDSIEYKTISNKYFFYDKYDIKNSAFTYQNENYSIREKYKNQHATVIVCSGPKTLTDYYFVSFDNEKSWKYLQNDFGDNRERFLYEDKYLYSYAFPFGLQRLKLK